MSFIKKIWLANKKNKIFKALFTPFKRAFDFYRYRIVDEKTFIKRSFYENHGYHLNLENPKTLNEKIQWLKLNDRTELHTHCADKIKVREVIKEELGEKYLIPLVFVSENIEDLTVDILPNFPFIIKTNHDSGSYFIVKNKESIDLRSIKEKLKKALRNNYYFYSKEWQYKNIQPKILIEKLLLDLNGNIPRDYKLHCIHGKVEMISVDLDRGTRSHRRNWYNKDWKKLPFDWASTINGVKTIQTDKDVSKPICLDEMIRESERISNLFKYVRVDWYELNGKLYFGELTFHHDSGMKPIEPYEYDLKYGNKLILTQHQEIKDKQNANVL